MIEKTWPCGHIFKDASCGYHKWTWRKSKFCVAEDAKYCLYCGAKRPEEPKALWKILAHDQYSQEVYGKRDAILAIEWLQNNLAKFVTYHNNVTRVIKEEELYKWLGDEKEKCK